MMKIKAKNCTVHVSGWLLRKYIQERWLPPHNSRRYYLLSREVVQDIHNLVMKSLLIDCNAFNFDPPLKQEDLRKLHKSLIELLKYKNSNFRVVS